MKGTRNGKTEKKNNGQEGVLSIKERARRKFCSGLSCTESLLELVCEEYGFDTSVYLPLASGFRAGISGNGCVCGALTGAVLSCGLLFGRSSPGGSEKTASELAGKVYERFNVTFGSSCCRVLNMEDYTSPEHTERCADITARTAGMLFELLGAAHVNR